MRSREEMLKIRNEQIGDADKQTLRNLSCARNHLDFLILATPTGKARTALTDANIHIAEALKSLDVWRNSL